MHRSNVPIQTPCGADWNSMKPRGSSRLCASCDRLVHDLSGMTERESHATLEGTPTSLCVRYLYDETGKIWHREDFERLIQPHTLARSTRIAAAAAVALAVLPVLSQACGGADPNGWSGAAEAGAGAAAPAREIVGSVSRGSDGGAGAIPDGAPSADLLPDAGDPKTTAAPAEDAAILGADAQDDGALPNSAEASPTPPPAGS